MQININQSDKFVDRHIGPSQSEIHEMLKIIGTETIDTLVGETIPKSIRSTKPLNIPHALSEHEFLEEFRKIISVNRIYKSYIGMGYYDTITPAVIQRNIYENPGWYTAYTPYQAEIAQGRLEALVNFQTMIMDLTGMDLANASLLDEGTAAGEAMTMLYALRKGEKKQAVKFLVDENIFPQTLAVLHTRARPLNINLVTTSITPEILNDPSVYGLMVQYPDGNGQIETYTGVKQKCKEHGIYMAYVTDLLSLTLLTPPGEMEADVVIGSTQRFGIPMGYGGPHAAFLATKEEYKRQIPGRIIGISVDAQGHKAYRMALQTREQHIRREKATSNICTAQVLLAVMAGMYAVYHGPAGLKNIALKIHGLTKFLYRLLGSAEYENVNTNYFDTLKIRVSRTEKNIIKSLTESNEINLRYFEEDFIGISIDETTSKQDILKLAGIFAEIRKTALTESEISKAEDNLGISWPPELIRNSTFLEHPVFNIYHSEHEILRYIKSLENKDLSLVHSMISLGSCTMKLNAATEMIPVSWPEMGKIHPYAPIDQVSGYGKLICDLECWLNEITGFSATSLQPNSGAQGEFTGLMIIRAYQDSRGEGHRNVTLIPSSAHGTNPASAVMAGTEVVIVQCDPQGNIDTEDLKQKAEKYKDRLVALMLTYPSTHGVFEEGIRDICGIIHRNGGQVYLDGANMNAQVGLTNPAIIGADVCHLNLHKTFCIPHGGGGPGVGPVCVADHLKEFLPGNPVIATGGFNGIKAISSAPWGSASILGISYAYIRLMGPDGLRRATEIAILNANYIKSRLENAYMILYSGKNGRCAHEMIIDCREFKKFNIEVEDIAKRLMDYGFHAPTVSFPVPGTLMVEPTESESLKELDKFCDAMLNIRNEIREIEQGKEDTQNNILKNAPHTQEIAACDQWNFPYSREKAVYPLSFLKKNKFWPSVGRIDSAYGDRNLFCSCMPVETYEETDAVKI